MTMIEFFEALNEYPWTATAVAIFIMFIVGMICDSIKKDN